MRQVHPQSEGVPRLRRPGEDPASGEVLDGRQVPTVQAPDAEDGEEGGGLGFCGTGYEVTPITSVNDIKIGEEYPDPITTQIAEYYAELLAGNIEKRRSWLTPV